MCLLRRSINSATEATATIALTQSIGSVHIFFGRPSFRYSVLPHSGGKNGSMKLMISRLSTIRL